MCLVEKYYQLSGNLRKLQKQWFARQKDSFTSWTVDELRYWLRTAKRILSKNKLTPSSQSQKSKQYTILADKNRNSDSVHRIHRILPVQPLHNFKNTPLSRFSPHQLPVPIKTIEFLHINLQQIILLIPLVLFLP